MRKPFVVIEGPDGCGKSSIGKKLSEAVSNNSLLLEFPANDTHTGPLIRSYLRKEWSVAGDIKGRDQASALAFQSLAIANRAEKTHEIISQLAAGNPVVLVRYWHSGWVYGGLDGLSDDFTEIVAKTTIQPDLHILLDVDPTTSMKRRAARDGELPPERYEGKLDFTEKVVQRYRDLWEFQKRRHAVSGLWVKVDANRGFDAVYADVQRLWLDEYQELNSI